MFEEWLAEVIAPRVAGTLAIVAGGAILVW
jgi:hypothetical protein